MFDFIAKLAAPELESQARVAAWAKRNRINPFDMGPKNYQRCLYDLGLGGVKHELNYKSNGKLKYQ